MVTGAGPAAVNAIGVDHDLISAVPLLTHLGVQLKEQAHAARAVEAQHDRVLLVLVVIGRQVVRVAPLLSAALEPEAVLGDAWEKLSLAAPRGGARRHMGRGLWEA